MSQTESQVIPKGYKQTEVGVIPEDWISETLETFTSFISYGFTNPMPTADSGPAMITARDIKNGQIQYSSARCTSDEAFNKELSPKSKPKVNDLLLTKDGTLGRLALVEKEDLCINQSVALLRPNKNINPNFFKLLLESPFYQDKMIDDAGGSTIKHIYITIVNKMVLGLPKCLKEQTAIANALSDVETLLGELEKIISKKKAIKTATMQQLLAGKTRLPQFSSYTEDAPEGKRKGQRKGTKPSELGEIPEDWVVVEFGDLFERNIYRKKIAPESEVTFVGMQDVSEDAKLVTPSKITYKSVKSGFTYFEQNDVLVAKITPCFENGKGCFTNILPTRIGFGSTEFHVLRATKNASAHYIYYISITDKFRGELESEMVGSAGHRRVPLDAIQSYLIPVSKSKEEQIAIATILSDMDEEIQALDNRLSKTRQIKQGMMQELLTGKTRLPFDKN